ncbi:hypothetical protein DSL72_000878 [Monilinia vaccinii-corymbosi]|uniref:Uncharacterized protein n=1 Tax=Monilinia vaccinii-corymbosi TaxID=61207 RepID=A0A8A3P094_9HELO|nr:hypothetical protein DSL72_000878 [Monilinia vaccinii-corymbosi]
MAGICWRCQAAAEGLDGERYEARRPSIDNAVVVESFKDSSPEGRKRTAEHAGNCWHCGASRDGIRDCEACDGTGSARKGKNKFSEDTPEGQAKKKRRTSTAVAGGGISKPRRGRPPGASGRKKKLGAIKEGGQMNLNTPSMSSNTAFQHGEFQSGIPEPSYSNHSWDFDNHHGDPTLPSHGMGFVYDSHPGQANPYISNRASFYRPNAVADDTMNPQQVQVEYPTQPYQNHAHPSIVFDHDTSHGGARIGNIGEGVRSDPQAILGPPEAQFAHFPTSMHGNDVQHENHNGWSDYSEGSLYPPPDNTNNVFALTDHDAHSGPVAPVPQMTLDLFTPQNTYSGTWAPASTSPATATATATATSAIPANTSPIPSPSASRLATPP